MLNSIEAYQEQGTKAGIAARRNDHGGYRWAADHVERMLALESPEDRKAAREAYAAAYKLANPPRKPEYFR